MTRVRGVVRRGVALAAVVALGALVACGGGDDGGEAAEANEGRPPEEVRIAYIVESSWFATNPEQVEESLVTAANHMTTCADSAARRCQVMVFAVQGAEVSAKRVPTELPQDRDTGYWYSLDPGSDSGSPSQRHRFVVRRIGELISAVSDEIVPESYDSQPKGCVNLLGNISTVFDEFGRHPGSRNIVVVLASGISNCQHQPFYPDRPFPDQQEAVAGILEDIPPGSALIGGDGGAGPVCFDWSPMFGEAAIEGGLYVSQEQRQVLKATWQEVLGQWGAVSGNDPGEQIGDCLTMEVEA